MSNRLAVQANEMDQRYRMAPGMRRQINKVFPSHWSFMLGEVALYSFIILLVSGVYLTLFFLPIVLSLGGAIASTALIIKASDEKYQLEEQTR